MSFKTLLSVLSLFLCGMASAQGFTSQTDPVLNAMRKELSRSMSVLAKAEKVPLYHLAYEITDSRGYSFTAEMGAEDSENIWHVRNLDVDGRIGSYDFDNTHEMKGMAAWDEQEHDGNAITLPIEDDENAIRASIWRWTDKTFKDALERYTKVKTNRAVTAEEDDKSDDFSSGEPVEKYYEVVEPPIIDTASWRARVTAYSGMFKGKPFIYTSVVNFSADTTNRYFVSSDGADLRHGGTSLRLYYSITTRTPDGMDLQRFKSYDGFGPADMPSDETVRADIERSIKELEALRNAPVAEPFSGPAILRNTASAVFFHEVLGHRVEGHRQKKESEGQTFAKKANEKVVSPVLSVFDDPAMDRFNGVALRGYYKFDNEGMPGKKASIIENGVLKGFLMGRVPIRNFSHSNGHGRRQPGHSPVSRMGNLIVTVKNPVPYEKLRAMLVDRIRKSGKPYGYIFDDISEGFTLTGRSLPQSFSVVPLLVYRVYPDGRPDEVVRGVNMVGTPLTAFSKVVAGASDPEVFDGTCGAESGWVPVSAVSPSLLLSEVETEKAEKLNQKPPLLPPPPVDDKGGR